MRILLDRFKSKSSNDKRKGVAVSFKNGKKLLSELNMTENLSEFETYRKERMASTKYRLVFEVNPVCSNVLFNTATEIVSGEGSSNVMWLTKTPDDEPVYIRDVIGKEPGAKWNSVSGIMDTQLSKLGFEYHCGYDIFDNHLLRATAFRVVNYANNPLNEFNTIADTQRDYNGDEVHRYPDDREVDETAAGPLLPNHLYDRENILSFDDAIDANLIERNGWFGFTNPTTMSAYYKDGDNIKNMGINRLINSKNTCDFIDMYPGRDLYSFVPKYNKSKFRFEKNWNYCLTYPSSSTTANINFINEDLESLRVAYFNEQSIGRDGRRSTTIYSVAKHGLGAGDTVNVYKTYHSGGTTIHEMCLSGVTVSTVVDDYTFTVYAGTQKISNRWIDVPNAAKEYVYYPIGSGDASTLTFNAKHNRLIDPDNPSISFTIIDGRCCVDPTTTELSFKRVEAGFECKYYVRIFSRLPNFKFATMDVTERNLYDPLLNTGLIEENEMVPFQDNLSKLAFASNSYSDANAELVFLDDVDVKGLRDNLGRPLTEIYLTCVKNNAGYKEWYGKNGADIKLSADTVEYSHAFGKVNCGYILSEASREDSNYCDILFMTNVSVNGRGNLPGMNIKKINPESGKTADDDLDDEINFNYNSHFYGDLCEFCVGSYSERSLQEVYHRFNTAQRELTSNDKAFSKIKEQCKYHEIVSDDFDSDGFFVMEYSLAESIVGAEGYIYKPHNRIELRTFNEELEVGYPRICTPRFINKISTGGTYQIRTVEDNYFEIGNKFLLYNVADNDYYNCIISSVEDTKTVSFNVYDKDWQPVQPSLADISIYRTASPDSSIPPYAFMSTDGSMRYFWHTVMANGFNASVEEEEYPFANGAFYVNKKVNIYVRRQDPYGFNGLWRVTTLGNIDGSRSNIATVDNYVTEGDTEC